MEQLSCSDIKKLKHLSIKYSVNYILRPNLHITINGAIKVNFYPHSKNKTAYICGTKTGKQGVSFEEAFLMSVTLPKLNGKPEKRLKNYTKVKRKMLSKKHYCNWCGTYLDLTTATLDHVIPISLGGLNNSNNYVLACNQCNKDRGNKMPELKHNE